MNETVKKQIETTEIVSFEEYKKITGKTVAKDFNIETLRDAGLRVTRLNSEKVLVDLNKTKTALTVIYHQKSVPVEVIYELNKWDAHVTGSVFRKSNREKYQIEKIGKTLVTK